MCAFTVLLFYCSDYQESTNVSKKNCSPVEAATDSETPTGIDVDLSHSPGNDELVIQPEEQTENEPSVSATDIDPKSPTTNTKEIDSNKDGSSKDSTEKTAPESSTNKPATVSKPKPSRDKNGGSVTGSRVMSKAHISGSESGGNSSGTSRKPASNSQAGCAGNYILEPDPKVNSDMYFPKKPKNHLVIYFQVQRPYEILFEQFLMKHCT